MASLKILVALCLVAVLTNAEIKELNSRQLSGLKSHGIQTIKAVYDADRKEYADANKAFRPIHTACRAKAKEAAEKCKPCYLPKCRARARDACLPANPPNCEIFNDPLNRGKACLFYRRTENCPGCVDSKSKACTDCVRTKCSARKQAVCPPTKPTVEPTCAQLSTKVKKDRIFNCKFYLTTQNCPICADTTKKRACAQCVFNRCKVRQITLCRPAREPVCSEFKNKKRHICLFYAQPSQCSACSDLLSAGCKSCISSKCGDRAKDQCGNFFTDAVGFFKDDLPNFFTDTIPNIVDDLVDDIDYFGDLLQDELFDPIEEGFTDFFTEILPELGEDIGGFFGDIDEGFDDFFTDILPDAFSDFGDILTDNIFDPVEDAFESLGGFVQDDILDPVFDFFDDAWDSFTDAFDFLPDVFDFFGDVGGGTKDFFEDIFGKKRRRRSLTSPPTCDQLKDKAIGCKYYKTAAVCPSCAFKSSTGCPGYVDAARRVRAAKAGYAWISNAKNRRYFVSKVRYDTNNKVGNSKSQYSNIDVEAYMFGNSYNFRIPEVMDFANPAVVGARIAQECLDKAKS